jgi:hypothetical protein
MTEWLEDNGGYEALPIFEGRVETASETASEIYPPGIGR